MDNGRGRLPFSRFCREGEWYRWKAQRLQLTSKLNYLKMLITQLLRVQTFYELHKYFQYSLRMIPYSSHPCEGKCLFDYDILTSRYELPLGQIPFNFYLQLYTSWNIHGIWVFSRGRCLDHFAPNGTFSILYIWTDENDNDKNVLK